MDDAGDVDPLRPAMMRAIAALDRNDLSERDQDKLLSAALAECFVLSDEEKSPVDHPKPSGPATDAIKRMEAEIAADLGKRKD